MALMRADIENKQTDTFYKRGLLRYEPWKVAFAGMLAGAALAGVLAGVIGYRVGSTPPAPIVIQLQQPAPAAVNPSSQRP